MNIHERAPVIYCKLFFFKYLMLYSALLRVSSTMGDCPSGNPLCVCTLCSYCNVFAIGEINILLLLRPGLFGVQKSGSSTGLLHYCTFRLDDQMMRRISA